MMVFEKAGQDVSWSEGGVVQRCFMEGDVPMLREECDTELQPN